ncbi:AAA family ATPase [Methylocystis sp.]|uniref:AAA family ATPase n=1 Tax=Methylocystis sp. TaxID=1911079 RepID=UPI002734284E|nr:AAA family ATPase [Methylocystis sp.]MDP3553959.1 AAA family ATPase [Methylocystis sp.]
MDFGTYGTSVTDNDPANLIEFTFGTDVLTPAKENFAPWELEEEATYRGASYRVLITPEGDLTRIKSLHLEFVDPKLNYSVELDSDGQIKTLRVNGNDIDLKLDGITLAVTTGTIFPEFRVVRKEANERPPHNYYMYMRRGSQRLIELVEAFLRPRLSARLTQDRLQEIAVKAMGLGPSPEDTIKHKRHRIGNKSLTNFLNSLSLEKNADLRREFSNIIAAAYLPQLLNRSTSVFKLMISETLYIGPARARSERYYRYQDLAVSEIDPDGKNFPMFLNSLGSSRLRQLSKWVEGLFGYGLTVSTEGAGHLSINIIEGKGLSSNLVDVGYGVSQILPVLAQIWWARERLPPASIRASVPALLAIEQPELHLHPAHQALLADAIVGEARSNAPDATKRRDVNFLIETHSETFINRLGELVSSGKINADDIRIILFEPEASGDRITTTSIATFNADGSLNDWPYGFFQPSIG